jgi:hypothetical protein
LGIFSETGITLNSQSLLNSFIFVIERIAVNQASQTKARMQVVWGIMLVMAGVGVIYRIPQVMPKIFQIEQFSAASGFVYFCFYLMAVVLIAGGGKKIYTNFRILSNKNSADRT